MKFFKKLSIALALLFMAAIPVLTLKPQAASAAELKGNATGYKQASDVKYNTSGEYLANWGAREEDCTFLTTYAQSFYQGNYTYEKLSQNNGGSSQTNASSSALYRALKDLMSSKHSYKTSYAATRQMYRYTDCVNGNSSYISSFYSGTRLNGTWDGGSTWNREHTWPNSKGLGGDDENDIIMLRPTWVDENSSRGNDAYGQSSGFYNPNSESGGKYNLHGDCARIVLYVYVRWGNTSRMWGQNGVMENMNVLLRWMEEDPVDTWEMGRNDVVEDITGTRNVFVDYPEFAWQLFGEDIPDDMSTPSGIAKNAQGGGSSSGGNDSGSDSSGNEEHKHSFGAWVVTKQPTATEDGEKKRTCACGEVEWETIPKTGTTLPDDSSSGGGGNSGGSSDSGSSGNSGGSDSSSDVEHEHEFSDWYVIKEPTQTEEGRKQHSCLGCGETEIITIFPNGDEHCFEDWIIIKEPTETAVGYKSRTCKDCGFVDVRSFSKDGTTESVGCESAIISGSSLAGIVVLIACGVVVKKGKKE